MKKTLLALSLIGCLALGMSSCVDIQQAGGNNSTSQITVQENNKGTTPVTDEKAPASTDSNGNTTETVTDANGGLQQGGANTEGGFGPIHRP